MRHAQIMEEIGKVFAEEVRTDCVGLWTVLWEVKQRLPALCPEEARARVLAIVREAIERGTVVPGAFVEMRFVPWEGSPNEAVERIEREWLVLLGTEPNIGDVVLFVARTAPS